jgi:AraC family transcriptional regulator
MEGLADPKMTSEQRMRLRSIIRILETAKQALPNGGGHVHRRIAKAVALLQAECALAHADNGLAARIERQRLPPWKVARVARFIDANLCKPIRVEEIAAIARLNPKYFSWAFRMTVGETPHAYIIRRRIERAQQMIVLTDKPLAKIALDCGLGDQSHLTHLFRRLVGVSPGKWRRLQAGAE